MPVLGGDSVLICVDMRHFLSLAYGKSLVCDTGPPWASFSAATDENLSLDKDVEDVEAPVVVFGFG